MYKDVLRAIDGVSIFPVISLVIFVLLFSFVLIMTIRGDKQTASEMALMPLGDKPEDQLHTDKKHNHV